VATEQAIAQRTLASSEEALETIDDGEVLKASISNIKDFIKMNHSISNIKDDRLYQDEQTSEPVLIQTTVEILTAPLTPLPPVRQTRTRLEEDVDALRKSLAGIEARLREVHKERAAVREMRAKTQKDAMAQMARIQADVEAVDRQARTWRR
jgi:hypothetical protein